MPTEIKEGQIVKNLIPSEPVTVTRIQDLGTMVSLTFTGINSNKVSNKVITHQEFGNLEVVTDQGSFNFKGDPEKFRQLHGGEIN